MKNYITVIITIVFLICPSICFSSYLIELKNGSTFITNHNWEEGQQIKFYHYGGVVGIPKNLVKAIKKSDIAYKEEIDSKQDGVAPKSKINEKYGVNLKSKINEKSDITPIEKKEKYETLDLEYYKEKKSLLEAELNSTLDILREATKNKDQKAKKKARDEVKKISEKMYDITDELIKKNNGKLPEGW